MTRLCLDLGSASDWSCVMQCGKFSSTNQKHLMELSNVTSSVWNFCACFSDVIWRGNQWWRLEMSAVFSGEPGKQYFRHNTAAPLPMFFCHVVHICSVAEVRVMLSFFMKSLTLVIVAQVYFHSHADLSGWCPSPWVNSNITSIDSPVEHILMDRKGIHVPLENL